MALEEAIYDGVDVLSVSIRRPAGRYFEFEDGVAIRSFHAVKNGIVVCSGVNTGPNLSTGQHVSQWLISTVGAGTLDWAFEEFVELETRNDNMYFRGLSLSEPLLQKFYDLIASEQAGASDVSPYNA